MNLIEFHPGAIKDTRESFEWYEQESPSAALRFLDSLEDSYARIASYPRQFPPYVRNTRRLIMKNFPFSIVFRELPNIIQVVAVAHAKRRPGYWKSRL